MPGVFATKTGLISKRKGSRLVLALDVSGDDGVKTLRDASDELKDYLVGIKLGIPFLLTTPLNDLRKELEHRSDDFVFIAEAKLADVSHVNALTCEILFRSGIDAVISHGFIGREGGLDGAKAIAARLGKGILVLVSMSHKGSEKIIDRALADIIREAISLDPDGIIAPATRPAVLAEVRRSIPSGMLIISPGVGAQGAPFGSAIRAGADYEIVGRAIYASEDPVAAARTAVEEQRKALRG
ncbi:MAG TPA: orotidine-5'-phosphate decarboxylase [Thermoproteota archaeon]|nr:orotidine-5'-phosphate decarboxylase [Thermoproteota archaeon]